MPGRQQLGRLGVGLVLALGLLALARPIGAASEVLLATTTSVQDTGLLDALLPAFTKRTAIQVKTIAVGSGAALRMGSEGNADLVIAHAPKAEEELLASGAIVSRRPLMENYFVIAGPPEDPAKTKDAPSAAEAYRRIAAARAPYVSRGDQSGTHQRERELLRSAGLDPDARWDGFMSTGAGMGLTLQVAGERRAYLLSDLGSFLAFRERIGLAALSREEDALRNVYSVLRVNSERFAGRLHAAEARALEEFLLGPEAHEIIGRFGMERFGQPLFRPLTEPPVPGA
jgi:tungstate transport system substrate-binding protein